MLIKIPPNHVFNLQKIPELEIQINHVGINLPENYSIRHVMISQIYVVSQFTNKIETVLHHYFHQHLQNGDIV